MLPHWNFLNNKTVRIDFFKPSIYLLTKGFLYKTQEKKVKGWKKETTYNLESCIRLLFCFLKSSGKVPVISNYCPLLIVSKVHAWEGKNRDDSGSIDHLSLFNQLQPSLYAKSSTDIGKIYSTPPIKIQIDPSKYLPRINQCSMNKEDLQDTKLTTKCYKAQGLTIPCTSPYNTFILPVQKPTGQE